MLNGKKQVAERAVYSAIEGAAKKLGSENPVEVLEKAKKGNALGRHLETNIPENIYEQIKSIIEER